MPILNMLHIPARNTATPLHSKIDVDQLFGQLSDSHIQELVLYIHGGVNNQEHAKSMAQLYEARLRKDKGHTISLVWETGILETIGKKITEIPLIGKLFPVLESTLIKKLKLPGSAGERGGGWGPKEVFEITEQDIVDLAQTIEQDFQEEIGFDPSFDEAIQHEIETRPNELSSSFYQHAISKSSGPNARFWGLSSLLPDPIGILRQVALSVAKRYLNKTEHGLQETIVEELLREILIGSAIQALWDDMKLRAKEMWEKDPQQPNHIASYFLLKLAEHQQKYSGFRVNLIGHSAGSIVICNMMATAAYYYPTLKFGSVIFLAPAATVDLFYEEVVSKPERYEAFHMITLTDEQEKNDPLVSGVYQGSLLYLVAGLLEPLVDQPISGMVRYLTNKPPFDSHKLRRIYKFLHEEGKNRLILAHGRPNTAGLKCSSKSHGGFNDDADTINCLIKLLN